MRKSLKTLTFGSVGLALALSTVALAEKEPFLKNENIGVGIIHYAKLPMPRVDVVTPMPTPGDPTPDAVPGGGSASIKGPIAMSEAGVRGGYGSALVSPRGGTMSTPRQRANREVRQMIRKMN